MQPNPMIAAAFCCLLLACDSKPVADVIPAPAPASPSALKAVVDEALGAAKVLVAYHPVACRVADASDAFGQCHDGARGYDAALACARDALELANAEIESLPSEEGVGPDCGSQIRASIHTSGIVTARFLSDFVDWMESNKAALKRAMRGGTIVDACDRDESICRSKPSEHDPYKYAGFGYAHVQARADCTAELFVCGEPNNVCWISKVASRLGVACDPSENTPSPLLSKATGKRISTGRP